MTYLITIIVLSLFGVGETVYLISKRRKNEKPICVGKDDCNIVLKSKYNKTFGIHNDVLGLLYYAFALAVHVLIALGYLVTAENIFGDEPIELLLVIFMLSTIVALAMSTRFVYLMAFKLKAWCQWCVGSAVTVMLMSLVVLFWILSAIQG